MQYHGQIGPSYALGAPILAMILYFLFIMVESSSETSHSASNGTHGERAVLYSFEIDGDGVEISHLYHFGAGSPRMPVPVFSGRSGAARRDLHQSE